MQVGPTDSDDDDDSQDESHQEPVASPSTTVSQVEKKSRECETKLLLYIQMQVDRCCRAPCPILPNLNVNAKLKLLNV